MSKSNWWAGLATAVALVGWVLPTTVVQAADMGGVHVVTPDDDEEDEDEHEDHEDHEDHEEHEDPETAS
jgi:hypothetical protein